MNRFEGKTVLITGAGSGIGRAIAVAFAQEGARVVATDLNQEALAGTVQAIAEATQKEATSYPLDVTRKEEVRRTVQTVMERFGRIDILVNNAGVSTMNPVVDLTEEEWDFNLNVNAKGVFLVSQAVLPHMIAAGGGKIVNTASMAAKIGAPFLAHYSASKFAVLGFTQALAREVAKYQINVNAVCPGFVQTPMQDREVVWEGRLRSMDPEEVRREYVALTPLGRLCQPEDVAKVVLFLASSEADFLTGQGINVTGGICFH
ncbi:MAG: SDR family NAD(P)-dependent oxidoreductase [Betaproteobacteria bacterium]